nr:MAG TPA: PhnA Zinc-Ribbon [Caudoviricetes sp.]
MGGHESDRLHYTRTCEMCGAVMQNVAPNKRLCPACVKQNQHQRDQKKGAGHRTVTP